MGAAQMNQQLITKAGQAVLMGQHHALKVQTTANFHDPLIDADLLLVAPLLKHDSLIEQIRLLRLTRYPAVADRVPFFIYPWETQGACQFFISVVTSIGDGPLSR